MTYKLGPLFGRLIMTLFVRHYEVQNSDVSLGHFFGRQKQVREIDMIVIVAVAFFVLCF